MAAEYALGIDVGGTKIYAGVVNLTSGKVVATARKRTHPERGADFFAGRLQDVAAAALDNANLNGNGKVAAIGIGLAGQVDRARGLLLGAPNLASGVVDMPIRDLLADRFHLPVTLGNDVEIGAYGEQHYGAARGCQSFVCVFVGTGVGGAIVGGGALWRDRPYRRAIRRPPLRLRWARPPGNLRLAHRHHARAARRAGARPQIEAQRAA
jgi:glucokinase